MPKIDLSCVPVETGQSSINENAAVQLEESVDCG